MNRVGQTCVLEALDEQGTLCTYVGRCIGYWRDAHCVQWHDGATSLVLEDDVVWHVTLFARPGPPETLLN